MSSSGSVLLYHGVIVLPAASAARLGLPRLPAASYVYGTGALLRSNLNSTASAISTLSREYE